MFWLGRGDFSRLSGGDNSQLAFRGAQEIWIRMSGFGSPRQSAYLLTKIFALFDSDLSESIDLDVELKQMVRVLIQLRDADSNVGVSAVNSVFEVLKARVVRHCKSKAGSLTLCEFVSAFQDPLTLAAGHDWIAGVIAQFFDRRNYKFLNAEFPFLPQWEFKELEDWHEVPQGLECTLPLDHGRKKARIPEKNWQCGFRIEAALCPPDGRNVQIKISKSDTVGDVLKRISDDWPGLRGRDFHPPPPSSLQLRKAFGGRIYFPDEKVLNIGYEFKSPGFCVERRDEASFLSSTAHSGSGVGVKEMAGAQPAKTALAVDPMIERLRQSGDRLCDLHSALVDERRRFQHRLISLEDALNLESDEAAALGDTLGGRYKADREDLKQQVSALRVHIEKSRLADLSE